MDTTYIVLADAVFALHLLFVLAIGLSTALFCLGAYRTRPLLAQLHCSLVYAMAIAQAVLLECPLVPLERSLREAAGESLWYHGSFIVFVVERATGFHLPVIVVTCLSILVIALTTAALLARLLATHSRTFRKTSDQQPFGSAQGRLATSDL